MKKQRRKKESERTKVHLSFVSLELIGFSQAKVRCARNHSDCLLDRPSFFAESGVFGFSGELQLYNVNL